METGTFSTLVNNQHKTMGYSIHRWGNEDCISVEVDKIPSCFLRPEDLEQIANDLRQKEREIELKKQLPEIEETVTFCGEFNTGMNLRRPLIEFEDGDILECIAVRKNDHGEDMAVFWNTDKNVASGLVKEIGGQINYKRRGEV